MSFRCLFSPQPALTLLVSRLALLDLESTPKVLLITLAPLIDVVLRSCGRRSGRTVSVGDEVVASMILFSASALAAVVLSCGI